MKLVFRKCKKLFKKPLILLFVFVFVFVFYLFGNSVKDVEDNGNLSVHFLTSDIMQIKNILPISDKLGVNLVNSDAEDGVKDCVEFSVYNDSNSVSQFQILLTKQFLDDVMIKENYVKFYLTDENDVPLDGYDGIVPSYIDLSYSNTDVSSKIIYDGLISGGETKKYKLYMWLSDSYSISDLLESFSVDVDVRIKWRKK